jgi:hypothetical protein
MEPPVGYGAVDRSNFRSPIAETHPERLEWPAASLGRWVQQLFGCRRPSRRFGCIMKRAGSTATARQEPTEHAANLTKF